MPVRRFNRCCGPGARDPATPLDAGRLPGLGSLAVPDAAIGDGLTRDDVFRRFANCAAAMVNVFFGDLVPDGTSFGVGSRSYSRAYFWACAAYEGWPTEQAPSSAFISSPVAIARSVLDGGDTDMANFWVFQSALLSGGLVATGTAPPQEFLLLIGDSRRLMNCWSYHRLWETMVSGISADGLAAEGVAEPDTDVACPVPTPESASTPPGGFR